MPQEEIFRKIASERERLQLVKDLVNANAIIVCKGKDSQIIRLVAKSLLRGTEIVGELHQDGDRPTHAEEPVICHVFIGAEKYFFEAVLTLLAPNWVLKLAPQIFHLQRRQNFRIRIPENFQGQFIVKAIAGKIAVFRGKLQDISTGGCAFLVEPLGLDPDIIDLLQLNNEIVGSIMIYRKEPISVVGEIRHVRFDTSTYITGVEFKPRGHDLDRSLFALTMDLHREFFSVLKV